MKLSGQKNQGAWFRNNRFIKALSGEAGDTQADFINALKEIDSFGPFVTALLAIGEASGVNGETTAAAVTVDVLAQNYGTVGIPLCVWLGKLAFDTYTKGSNGKYKADHAKAVATFANDLRHTCAAFRRTLRLYEDVENVLGPGEGNPGGVADATKDT